jgi:arsenate reductase (thioredoxin)
MIRRVLFLCIGNSCRSQMAEAIVNARYPQWRAFSAGSKPTGYVHPKAIQVLKEIEIQHRGESKNVDQFRGETFDLVVTVCDEANAECPVWLGGGKQLHEPFRDPSRAQGSEQEQLVEFRRVRDEMLEKIPALLI